MIFERVLFLKLNKNLVNTGAEQTVSNFDFVFFKKISIDLMQTLVSDDKYFKFIDDMLYMV